MTATITVTTNQQNVTLDAPYHPDFPPRARAIGGDFDGATKTWTFDAQLPEPEGTDVTTRQAAQALGVSVRTVQRWAQAGKVQAAKDPAGRWVVTVTINEGN